ncbi:MAG: PAS domain S-box protein [Polyangiaceae bacterium]|nr:PAS domain S-box protein [Polyangiaceae bacterium]
MSDSTPSIPFERLIALAPGAVLACDGVRWRYANQRARELLGDACNVDARIVDCFLETEAARVDAWLQAARLTPSIAALTCRGTGVSVEARAQAVDSEMYAVFLRDLTRQDLLTARLKDSEDFKERVLEMHPGVIYVFDLVERRPVFVNPQFAKLLGYDENESQALIERFTELLHPTQLDELSPQLERWETATDDAIFETVHRLRAASGSWRWFLGRDRVFRRDSSGRVTHIVGITTDVTDRVLDEQALRASEARFRAIYEGAGMGIALCSLRGGVLEANDALAGMLALPSGELRGALLEDLVISEERSALRKGVEALGAAATYRGEHRLEQPSDSPRWAQLTITTAGGADAPGYLIAMFENITARKQAEQNREIRAAGQLQTQKLESLALLAGGIAHDFNNLLLGMLGNAALARKFIGVDSPAARHLELIESAAVAAGDLTTQMLAFTGRAELNKTSLALGNLLRETVDLLAVRTAAGSATRPEFVFEIADQLPEVWGDAGQLRQVCMNLVANATDALRGRRGRIFARVTPQRVPASTANSKRFQATMPDAPPLGVAPNGYVCLDVEDEGSGMNEETLSRIFDPFFTTKPGGKGLGLASVMGIVRAHQGIIHVESSPQAGTRFQVWLPSSTGVERPPPTPSAQQRGAALLIDDDEMVREVTKSMLELEGFEVLSAENGSRGLALFAERDVQVVVLDLTMPDLSGEEVFTQLRARRPELPVLFTTGFTSHEASERLLQHPRVALLHKPYRLQALKEHLERAIGPSSS